jgi:hypothetical protein
MKEIGLPLSAAIPAFVALALSGPLPADGIDQGLKDRVAFVLRGCAP